jgi:hypothetical protein
MTDGQPSGGLGAALRSFDFNAQIYLILMVIVVLGCFLTGHTWALSIGNTESTGRSTLLFSGFQGVLIFISAVGGVGAFFWSVFTGKRPWWLPATLVAAAALALAMSLWLFFSASPGVEGTPEVPIRQNVDMGIGWYLAFLASIGALLASVNRMRTRKR